MIRIFSPLVLPIVLMTRRVPSGVNVADVALPSGGQNADEQACACAALSSDTNPIVRRFIPIRCSAESHDRSLTAFT